MDRPARLLIAPEILRLNKERLEELSRRDPVNRPPKGFWSWQLTLRTLRTVLCWRAAQKEQPSPWPDQRALKIKSAPARELPVELQSVEGRRRLIEGLKAIGSPLARGCQFICYTGLRRRAAASLSRDHLIANGVLEFKSKTRMVRVPLSRQAAALIDPHSDAGLLHVGDKRLKQPLVKIFGERKSPRGKRARVTPHDLRRYFKSVGTELGIDPTIMNLLVGHTVKGVDKHYIAKLRLSVLRAAAQRIADEIDNPQETSGDDAAAVVAYASPPNPQDIGDYLFHRELPTLGCWRRRRSA
jgi:integrase